MFRIEKGSFGTHVEYLIRNRDTGEYVAITDLGSNVRSLALRAGASEEPPIPIILGYDTPGELEEGRWARGIKMIPFPNRIQDGVYEFGSKEFHLPINFPQQNHAIHGLLSRETMQVKAIEEAEDLGAVTFEYDFAGKFDGYPFNLQVQVRNELTRDGFSVRTSAKNMGDEALPFGDGWHPYYRFGSKSDVNRWELMIPARSVVEMDDRLIPTGELIPVGETMFDFRRIKMIDGVEFDNVFTDLIKSDRGTIAELRDGELGITIEVWQDRIYKYMVVFTPPDEHRNCVAIEPMTCNTNAFNNGEGLIVLGPGERFQGAYGVRVR